jgi:hypothetical protein
MFPSVSHVTDTIVKELEISGKRERKFLVFWSLDPSRERQMCVQINKIISEANVCVWINNFKS